MADDKNDYTVTLPKGLTVSDGTGVTYGSIIPGLSTKTWISSGTWTTRQENYHYIDGNRYTDEEYEVYRAKKRAKESTLGKLIWK